MGYSKEQLVKMYEQMVLGRKYEEKVLELVNKGVLQGFFHLSIGQEAAQVGAVAAMGPDDYLVPTHRFHPGLANRMDIRELTAELLGKITGSCKGKAFTFHISSTKDRILAVNGMLGAGIPNAVGYAWALKQDKTGSVVLCVIGDGATSEGDVYEGMNLAALFKCPIVFFIENNGWGISTPVSKASCLENLSDKSKAYGMPGMTVDGDDVIAVREAVEKAIELARTGQPCIVEAKTCRWRGHFEGDPALYRDPAEVERAMKNDPIIRLENSLISGGYASKADLNGIEAEVDKLIDETFDYALKSPLPTPEETLDYDQVYASNLGGDLL
ncbi:MAG: thiamine pyrophosphate-dependent dehydrogenase E1 component subunit alpha [Bacillota bacterium]